MNLSQKRPFAQSLNNFTQRRLAEFYDLQGKALPCSVISVNGAIVTVSFEITAPEGVTLPTITCPIAESSYVRLPVQVGDLGVVIPASTRLGGVTGLGIGLADFSAPTNLGGLLFIPLGHSNWPSVSTDQVNVNGPNGVILRDSNNQCSINLTSTGVSTTIGSTTITTDGTSSTVNVNGYTFVINSSGITATVGSSTLTITSSSIGITATDISLTGSVTINGAVTGTMSVGSISASGDVTASGISLSSHVHGGVTTGSGDTSPPL